MKSKLIYILFFMFGFNTASHAFFIDFEDGTDGALVNDITGVSFQNFNGFDALYIDCSTGGYNCTSDDLGYSNNTGMFHHNGDFSLWAGQQADARGVMVDFTNDDGTWFQTGYSSFTDFHVEAWLTDGSMVSVSGAGNTGGPMDFLYVEASQGLFIDYVVLHDTGNQWLVDDMSGDASGVRSVPEPGTLALLGLGLLGVSVGARRRVTSSTA